MPSAVLLTSGNAQTAPPFIPTIIGVSGQDWPAVAAGARSSSCRSWCSPSFCATSPARPSPSEQSANDTISQRPPAFQAQRLGMLASVLIAAGVVMLMQPFALAALFLVLRHNLAGHGDVHHRQPFPGVGRWRKSGSRMCAGVSAPLPPCVSSTFTIEDGEFFMPARPSGCGKTTTLRMMAGLELPTRARYSSTERRSA